MTVNNASNYSICYNTTVAPVVYEDVFDIWNIKNARE